MTAKKTKDVIAAEKVASKVKIAALVAKKQASDDRDELLGAIETRLDIKQFSTRIDRVEEFLYYGNGDSLKQWMATTTTKLDNVAKSTDLIIPLKEAVDLHHAEPHLWKWVVSPKFWITLFIVFTVLHTISTYVPNVWNWVATLLGVPHLVLPLQ